MTKLAVFSAFLLLALLAFVAEASFRTTINTVVEEGDSQWEGSQQQPRRCQQQIEQRRQQLRQCQQFLSQGSRHETDVFDQVRQGEQQHRQCCQGLQSLDRQCRCEAVSQIVQQQRGQEGSRSQRGERQEEIMEKARYLPESCNLEPRQCQIFSPYY